MLGWLATFSIVSFLGTLVLVPIFVVNIPEDYFSNPRRNKRHHDNVVLHYVLLALKNALGLVFVLAGIAMLVLPGQGLLTLLIGLIIMDFPGKYRLERWLISRSAMLKTLNWIRRRSGKPELKVGSVAPLGPCRGDQS